ncbi:MAG: LacI family DNA-binding transcriptional regulator [Rhodoglobus sp.]
MDGTARAAPKKATARPTLAAVAARAGVSGSTASLAFSGAGPVSEATRAKVIAAAEALGYAGPDPRARSLRRGRSGIVGFVLENRLQDAFCDPMALAMLDGIAGEVGAAGAGLLLLTDTGGPCIDVVSAPIDAAILSGCSPRLEESVTLLHQRGVPVVAIEASDIPGVLPITLDNRDATAHLMRHLYDLGHRRIAVVTLPLDGTRLQRSLPSDWEISTTAHTALDRLRGVRDVHPEFSGIVATSSSSEAGRAAGLALLAVADRPTAVIAQSDLLAVGVIKAAISTGIAVPEHLSVVGFDGAHVEGSDIYDLTTMVQPAAAKGRAAGRVAIDLIEGRPATAVAFTSEFHRGATTAIVCSDSLRNTSSQS